jgi:hypothetical protein
MIVPVNYCKVMVLPETSSLRARRWCFLGPLRTRAGSIAHYTIHIQELSKGSRGRGGRRRGGEKQTRDEGTGERAKEVARTAGGTVRQQELG